MGELTGDSTQWPDQYVAMWTAWSLPMFVEYQVLTSDEQQRIRLRGFGNNVLDHASIVPGKAAGTSETVHRGWKGSFNQIHHMLLLEVFWIGWDMPVPVPITSSFCEPIIPVSIRNWFVTRRSKKARKVFCLVVFFIFVSGGRSSFRILPTPLPEFTL